MIDVDTGDGVRRIGAVPPQPDNELIETLAGLLEAAQSGELQGLAFIGYLTDSNIRYGNVGREMTCNYLRTYGLLHWLANVLMKRWEDQ